MPTLSRTESVFLLDLGDTENRFHPDLLAELSAALDEVVAATGPKALVTSATGKFWSNGLDLEWVAANPDSFMEYAGTVQALMARILELPMPTVAAIQGHAFAAGAMLTLCHDLRVMRADRGFWCLPEVDINIPFTQGMNDLITSRLAPQVAHVAMTTGRRYGGADAAAAAIVDAAAGEAEVLPAAMEMAAGLAGKASPTLGAIKARMYAGAIESLRSV